MSNQSAILAADEWLVSGLKSWFSGFSGVPGLMLIRKLKAICEIAFLEYVVSPVPSNPVRASLKPILRDLLQDPFFWSLARYEVEHANLFLPLIYAGFQANPDLLEDPVRQRELDRLVDIMEQHAKERLPFRILDLYHGLYSLTGRKKYHKEILEIARFGCLGSIEQLHDIAPSDEYAITHTIFYVTDFGKYKWPSHLAPVSVIAQILDALADRAFRKDNLDLLGEYVLCRELLGISSARQEKEVAFLSREFDPKGFWRGPADLRGVLLKEGFVEEQMEFFENYHTTIVVQEALRRYLHGNLSNRTPLKFDRSKRERSRFYLNPDYPHLLPESTGQLASGYLTLIDPSESLEGPLPGANELTEMMADPALLLPALELMYWRAQKGETIEGDLLAILREIAKQDPAEFLGQPRFLRIWALVQELTERSSERNESLVDALVSKIASDYESRKESSLHLLITACLLAKNENLDLPELQGWVSQYLDRAVIDRDPAAFADLWSYGLAILPAKDPRQASWKGFLHSMFSEKLPFGWSKSAEGELDPHFALLGWKAIAAGLIFKRIKPTAVRIQG